MGKLTSYLLGLTAALSLVYDVLYVNYQPLINWLGPVVGSDIIFAFGFLFLLLGSVAQYQVVLISWIVIGVLVGLGSRKGTKAIGAAVGVYSSIWGFLGLSALAVFQKISGSSFTGASLTTISTTGTSFQVPPLPPGVTLSSILSEPLFQPLTSIISSFSGLSTLTTGTGGTTTPTASLSSFITVFTNTLLPYMIVNLALFLIISGVTGMLLHKALNHNGSPRNPNGGDKSSRLKKVKVKKTKVRKVVRKVKSSPLAASISIVSIIILSLLLSPTGLSHGSIAGANAASYSTLSGSNNHLALNSSLEAGNFIFSSATMLSGNTSSSGPNPNSFNYGGGYVGKYGNVYNIYAFLNSSSKSVPVIFGTGSSNTPVLSAVFVSYNLETIFNSLKQDGFISSSTVNQLQINQYYNLIPQAVILEAYTGNVSTTSGQAQQGANSILNSLGGNSMVNFISINLPSTVSSAQSVSLFGYSFNVSYAGAESTTSNAMSSYFPQDGVLSVFTKGLKNGYLVPGSTHNSDHGSIYMAGFADLNQLPSNLKGFSGFLNTTSTTTPGNYLYFMGGLFASENVFHSSAASHNITASGVFNYNGNITFGSNLSVYAMSLLYPYANASGSSAVSGYRMLMYSNYQNSTSIGNAGSTSYTLVSSGQQISLSNISLPTNVTFPAQIKVSQYVSILGNNAYKVTISLTNNDTDTLQNVEVNAAPLLGLYSSNVAVTSGATIVKASALQPGQTLTMTYDISFSGVGRYVVATPLFNYTSNNSTFSVVGNTLTANAQNPSIFHAVNQLEYVSFSALSNMVKFPYLVQTVFPGVYVFDLIILLVVVLDVYLEVRAFRKWLSARKGRNGEPPSPPETEQDDMSNEI